MKHLSEAQNSALAKFTVDFATTYRDNRERIVMLSLENLGLLWSVDNSDIFVLTKKGYQVALEHNLVK